MDNTGDVTEDGQEDVNPEVLRNREISAWEIKPDVKTARFLGKQWYGMTASCLPANLAGHKRLTACQEMTSALMSALCARSAIDREHISRGLLILPSRAPAILPKGN